MLVLMAAPDEIMGTHCWTDLYMTTVSNASNCVLFILS